jgi:Cu2+-exporting ATPase
MSLAFTGPSCAHCRLPVPDALALGDDGPQFCCTGCRTAHALIHAHGLACYYDISDATGTRADGPRLDYAGFDAPAFLAANTEVLAGGERRTTFAIDGIHCAACIWLLERLPRIVPGVIEARASWRRSTLTVRWQGARLSQIADAVARLGYRPSVLGSGTAELVRTRANRRALVEIGIAGAAAGNNMLIAAALYLGMFSYMDDVTETMLRWASCIVGVLSVAWPGRVFVRGAWQSLRARTPHMDLPVALGLVVGAVAGLVNTVLDRGEIYFDTLSVLVFLLLVGRFIQTRQQQRAAATVEVLHRLTPRTAHRVEGDRVADVPAQVVASGDLLEIRAGEVVPADATIVDGASAIDASILTGETRPVDVGVGDAIAAGALNLSATLRVRVDAVGERTRIGRVLELVESSAQQRPKIVQLADRIGARFVVAIVVIASTTLAAWLTIDAAVAVDHTVALLVVACPCALAMATPLAISVALGRAARRRILIKGGDVLQRLSERGTIWLDKTGTLSEGRARVVAWIGDESVRPAVAALEHSSIHPVALALQNVATAKGIATAVRHGQGGLEGVVDGRVLVVGNERFVATRAQTNAALVLETSRLADRALSPVFIAVDGTIVAVAGVGDPLREDATAAVAELRARGHTVGILSGDHPAIVRAVGRSLGIPDSLCHGGLDPEAKVEHVRNTTGPVVMVGDGVNDSAALAAASVGIATRDGAEASLEAAPVYLGRPGLGPLLELLDGSRATMRAITRNFAVSLFYNGVSVGLAAAGLINPLVAALLMPLSSLGVIGLSLSLRWPRRDPS